MPGRSDRAGRGLVGMGYPSRASNSKWDMQSFYTIIRISAASVPPKYPSFRPGDSSIATRDFAHAKTASLKLTGTVRYGSSHRGFAPGPIRDIQCLALAWLLPPA